MLIIFLQLFCKTGIFSQHCLCGAEVQGKRGGKRENEPGIILCSLSSTGLKSCFFFSSPIPGALSRLSSQAGQSWSSSSHAAALLSGGQGEAQTLQTRGRNAGNGVENLSCLGASLVLYKEGLEQKCFCAPFLQSIHWQKRRTGLWGCAFTLFSLFMYSLVPFLLLLVVQTRQQVG